MPRDPSQPPSILKILGPSLLFAGAAIGVSHLVQSTRAGAAYGLALIPAMLLVHVLKYPGLSAGARFAGATGRTLVSGYRSLGPASLGAAGFAFFAAAIPIQAALASVTAAVAVASLRSAAPGLSGETWPVPAWAWAMAFQGLSACLAIVGGYRWLDRIMKAMMSALALLTIAAAISVAPRLDLASVNPLPDELLTAAGLTFFLAFLGWMPAPLDVAMWNSLWCVEKQNELSCRPAARTIKLEFLIGYGKCVVLAAAFIVMGAAVIYGGGAEIAPGAGVVDQLLANYGEALSPALKPVVAVCAFGVMFSTLLSSTDAIPRVALEFAGRTGAASGESQRWLVAVAAGVLIAIATGVLAWTHGRPGAFLAVVDFATVVSFLSTPVLALVHHRILLSDQLPSEHRARPWEAWLSRIAIGFFTLFALAFGANFVAARFG